MVFNARKDDPGHVGDYQDQRQVARELVEVVHPLHTPEGVHGHHNAGGAEHDQGGKQSDYHGSTGRVVAKVALGSHAECIGEIAEDGSRAIHKVSEARIPRAGEAPDDTRKDQDGDPVPGYEMLDRPISRRSTTLQRTE